MNIVEFALKFKDLASTELNRFGTTARTTFANANTMANNLTGHNRVLGQSYNALQAQIRAVESTIRNSTIPSQIRDARRELASLQRQAANHRGNIGGGGSGSSSGGSGGSGGGLLGIAGLEKFAGPAAIATVAYAAGSFFGETFSKALERQQVLTSFSVLAGSKGAGDALSKDLIKYQKDTILGPEVFKNAQTMMGFGFKSTEVMPNMKMLGDVSMGNPEKLGALTLAFSQTRAAGKLMGQDLLQYISAGFNPLNEITKRTGKSSADLRKEMENGNISFAMVQQAFKDATSEGGTFNNMLETIAKTPAGKMQALSGAWNEFKVSAGTAFMPLLSMAIDFGSKMLPMIEKFINPLSLGIAYVVDLFTKNKSAILDFFAPAVNLFNTIVANTDSWAKYFNIVKWLVTEHIWPAFQKIWNALFGIVSKMVEFYAKSEIIKDIFRLIMGIGAFLFDVIGWVVDKLKWVFDNIILPICQIIDDAYKLIKGSDGTTIKVLKTTKVEGVKPVTQKTNAELMAEQSALAAQNSQSVGNSQSAVSGGGPKVINITVQKVLDVINIHTTTLENGVNEMESIVLEAVSRVLGQGVAQAL